MSNQVLLNQVKRKLNITWDDDVTTARLEEIIASAIPDLKHKLGIVGDFDFSAEGMENILFLNYCLYEWNHAIAEFDLNYERMIAQVRSKNDVAHYIAQGDEDAES